ncbi:hypothetical protein FTUN_5415 [Frigoriglobus tundricola]|uniref:Uncharacterized protein n=1 Tax=Frigoriglobus tundricola TaxID=2774151 RepID=A0A6M5YUV3_9BACT|nr:hypothetical protein FTUN_5415 [Frigoriglobus tundricola]
MGQDLSLRSDEERRRETPGLRLVREERGRKNESDRNEAAGTEEEVTLAL